MYAIRSYYEVADIVAVRGNPLTDIRKIQNVSFVMKNGYVYRNGPPEN